MDRAQYETGEGPCVDAARRHETVRCDDMRAEARWPRFARRAAELGVLSMLSFQLFVQDWHRDGNLGRLGQINTWTASGHEFFAEHRLLRYLHEPAA
jgi:hypothetical protein